jgi:hypothetical protein
MTIHNIDQTTTEQTLVAAMHMVANTGLFVQNNDLYPLTPNQRATNDAINAAVAIVNNPNFEHDPETVTMRALSVLNASAKELASMNEKSGYLTAYILCRRLTHQATYMGITALKDANRYKQQLLRSNVSAPTRHFIAADDWASEFTTTETHATAEELSLPQDEVTPRDRARAQVVAADEIYTMLKRPMDTFCTVLTMFENDLAVYLASVGNTDYTRREFLHSYTSVAFGQGQETEYREALSFAEAEQLLAEKAAKRVESRVVGVDAALATRAKALRAL